jgi:hypothetical protein
MTRIAGASMENKEKKGPIFIVGMNGSGTTMLADCLNHHSLIYFPEFETKVIPFYARTIDRYGNLEDPVNFQRLLDDFSNNHVFRRLNSAQKVKIPFDFENLKRKDLSEIINLTFSYFASRKGKIIWGDHSPKYAVCIPTIVNLFPGAKIIHITRDGRDCALSFSRRFRQNIYRSIFQWKNLIDKARRDGSDLGGERYLEMRYEDLTSRPEYHMRSLSTFLGLPFEPSVLDSNMPMFKSKGSSQNLKNMIVPNSGKWKSYFSPSQVRKMEAIAGKMLAESGYDVVFEKGDRNIVQWKLFAYRWMDRMNSAMVYWKNYKGKDRLGLLLRIAKASLKQGSYYER